MAAPPSNGSIVRNAVVSSAIVGRFDEADVAEKSGERQLLPDFASAKPPLRMKVTTSSERSRGANGTVTTHETLSLQDASGIHSFSAEKQNLDSHYSA